MRALRKTWRVLFAAYKRFERDDGAAMAGYVAFSVFLSLFPFAIFFSALAGILIGEAESQRVIDALFQLAPEHVAKTLTPVLDEVMGRERGGLLTISGIGAIWVASNAVEAVRVAFDRAYDAEETRGFLRRRLIAIAFLLLATVTFAALGLLIIVAPLALKLAENYLGVAPPNGIDVLRYALALAGFCVFLFVMNRWLPSRAPKSREVWPGILVSAALFLIGATGFSLYLAYAPSYTLTYGAFAGVIVTLLFFYLTGAALIFGAEVNAAMLDERAADDQMGES